MFTSPGACPTLLRQPPLVPCEESLNFHLLLHIPGPRPTLPCEESLNFHLLRPLPHAPPHFRPSGTPAKFITSLLLAPYISP